MSIKINMEYDRDDPEWSVIVMTETDSDEMRSPVVWLSIKDAEKVVNRLNKLIPILKRKIEKGRKKIK